MSRPIGRVVTVLALLFVALIVAPAREIASGQSEPASKADVGAVKAEVERLRNDLDGIKGELRLMRELLLQRQAQPPGTAPHAQPPGPPPRVTAKVKQSGAASMGKAEASVVLVEFSDYQCPFCKRFSETTLQMLKKEYIDTGKVRFVYRDFPIDQIHSHARKAAEAARCAGDQGKYWEMHDRIFENQRELAGDKLKAYARKLGLNAAFDECVDKGKYAGHVQKDHEEGAAAGVRGTPTFFVGKNRRDDMIEGLMISGARPLVDFRREIDRLLSEK